MKRARVSFFQAGVEAEGVADVADGAKVGDRAFVDRRLRDSGVVRRFEGKIVGFVGEDGHGTDAVPAKKAKRSKK